MHLGYFEVSDLKFPVYRQVQNGQVTKLIYGDKSQPQNSECGCNSVQKSNNSRFEVEKIDEYLDKLPNQLTLPFDIKISAETGWQLPKELYVYSTVSKAKNKPKNDNCKYIKRCIGTNPRVCVTCKICKIDDNTLGYGCS